MPDDHSKLAPLLPISNRTVKRLSADDSAGSRVKVGHCQALMPKTPNQQWLGVFLCATTMLLRSKSYLYTPAPAACAACDQWPLEVVFSVSELQALLGDLDRNSIPRSIRDQAWCRRQCSSTAQHSIALHCTAPHRTAPHRNNAFY